MVSFETYWYVQYCICLTIRWCYGIGENFFPVGSSEPEQQWWFAVNIDRDQKIICLFSSVLKVKWSVVKQWRGQK